MQASLPARREKWGEPVYLLSTQPPFRVAYVTWRLLSFGFNCLPNFERRLTAALAWHGIFACSLARAPFATEEEAEDEAEAEEDEAAREASSLSTIRALASWIELHFPSSFLL